MRSYVLLSPSPEREEINALLSYRQSLMEECQKLKDQSKLRPHMSSLSQDHIEFLLKKIKDVEKKIRAYLKEHKTDQDEVILSMPGIGYLTLSALKALLPELGILNRQQVASLVGLAPIANDSGKKSGQRFIFGGRSNMRRALYMPALWMITKNPKLMAVYGRLKKAGKPSHVAITAVMRKMIVILNIMVKRNTLWEIKT